MRLSSAAFGVILVLVPSAFAAAVSVNGACQVGNCSAPDVLPSGSAGSTAFNFAVTLPNSDQYRIVGNVNSSSGSGNTVNIVSPFMVIYEGNKTGTSSAADVIALDVLQNFQLGFTLRDATESAQGGFGGALAPGSSAQIQLVSCPRSK